MSAVPLCGDLWCSVLWISQLWRKWMLFRYHGLMLCWVLQTKVLPYFLSWSQKRLGSNPDLWSQLFFREHPKLLWLSIGRCLDGHKHKATKQCLLILVLKISAAASSQILCYLFRHFLLGLHIQGETHFSLVLSRNACLSVAEKSVDSGIVVHDACSDSKNLMLLLKLCYCQCLLDGMNRGWKREATSSTATLSHH